MENEARKEIVFTLTARCRDCYRCLRVCPVKAIRLKNGQASVDADRCIACGSCIRECPQGAKTMRDDTETVQRLLDSGARVAASVAPSYAAVFPEWQKKRLASALRAAGFCYIGETARGTASVAHASVAAAASRAETPSVCTACPAVVNLVEKYHHGAVDALLPVASPMIVHARQLRRDLGDDVRIVFIGPCVAKKSEAERPEYAGLVDAVLTFTELANWLERRGIKFAACEESGFDENVSGDGRLFPLPGGLLKTGGMDTDGLKLESFAVHGVSEIRETLEGLAGDKTRCVIEPLFCPQGCIGGPGIDNKRSIYERRKDIVLGRRDGADAPPVEPALAGAQYGAKTRPQEQSFTDSDIERVLAASGKASPELRLNCGACGYNDCRAKAVAVLEGMAEPEMCLPYMRRLAERRTDRIIETSPNGIVILDGALKIVGMNPAFKKFFLCSDVLIGEPVSHLMDPEPFEKLVAGTADQLDLTVTHAAYSLVCHELLYALRDERLFIGIFINVTASQGDRERLEQIRQSTVQKARELLEHQISMAQKMAQFLGESTARGEELVDRLLDIAHENHEEKR